MARPITRELAYKLQRQKKINYHSLVDWNGKKYVIWKDKDGPVYSTLATRRDASRAAQENMTYIGDVYDTITWKVMNEHVPSIAEMYHGG
jgi:hypothetical protein